LTFGTTAAFANDDLRGNIAPINDGDFGHVSNPRKTALFLGQADHLLVSNIDECASLSDLSVNIRQIREGTKVKIVSMIMNLFCNPRTDIFSPCLTKIF
jgi:hypothetical protein